VKGKKEKACLCCELDLEGGMLGIVEGLEACGEASMGGG